MTEERRAVVLVVGVLAWTAIFVGVRIMLGHKRSYDFCNRVVSLLHVAVALLLCSMSVDNWWHPFHPLASRSSPQQLRAITISLSYFIYDFFCCLLETPTDVATALHHLLSILGLAYGFAHASSGTELVACLWLMEISNPFMHARELLKELGAKDSTVAVINDACFALIFLVARLGVGPYLTFITLQANNPVTVKVGAAGIQIVSIFWAYKIIRLVYYKILRPRKIMKEL